MPNTFTVNFTFEAEGLEEAKELVGTWIVTPGTVLTSLMGTINPMFRPTQVGMDGKVGTAVAAAEMKDSMPPMQPGPPPPTPQSAPPPIATPQSNESEE